jgi:hypothetical protein
VIHFVNEAQQRLFFFAQSGSFHIPDNALNQVSIAQQFRRDRGVRLHSKRALILPRRVGRDQLPECRRQRSHFPQDLLRELRQMLGRPRLECEQVPDFRVLPAARSHPANTLLKRAWFVAVFDVLEEHEVDGSASLLGGNERNTGATIECAWKRMNKFVSRTSISL